MSVSTDRKAKRIERIRGEIMDAAVKIIGEKGFKNTTTKEIAQIDDNCAVLLCHVQYFFGCHQIVPPISQLNS